MEVKSFEGGIKVPYLLERGISEKEIFERAAHIDIAPTIYALAKEAQNIALME